MTSLLNNDNAINQVSNTLLNSISSSPNFISYQPDFINKPIDLGILTVPLWVMLVAIAIIIFLLYKNGTFDSFFGNVSLIGGNQNNSGNGSTNNADDSGNNSNDKIIKIYNFNTEWCVHSKDFQPIWDEFSFKTNNLANFEALDVKCDNEDGNDICDEYKVKAFPSIILEKNDENGELIRIPFDNERTLENLQNFRDSN
jgi:thiol-disulfide isomerase/thioredoxin